MGWRRGVTVTKDLGASELLANFSGGAPESDASALAMTAYFGRNEISHSQPVPDAESSGTSNGQVSNPDLQPNNDGREGECDNFGPTETSQNQPIPDGESSGTSDDRHSASNHPPSEGERGEVEAVPEVDDKLNAAIAACAG